MSEWAARGPSGGTSRRTARISVPGYTLVARFSQMKGRGA